MFFYNMPHPSEVIFELVTKTEMDAIHNGYVEFDFIKVTIKYIFVTLLEVIFSWSPNQSKIHKINFVVC